MPRKKRTETQEVVEIPVQPLQVDAVERDILCRDITLEDRMRILRVHFDETVLPDEGKKRTEHFTRAFVLDDYKVTGKLPEKRDKDGRLIHQNRVFLSGHLRGPVVSKICNELTKELYPGRDPMEYLKAVNSYATLSGKFLKDRNGDIDAHIKVLKAALNAIERAYNSPSYSHASMAFYLTTKATVAGFGRCEGDMDADEETE